LIHWKFDVKYVDSDERRKQVDLDIMPTCRTETGEIILLNQKTTDKATRVAGACASSIVLPLLK
jgi:hypothetical protein